MLVTIGARQEMRNYPLAIILTVDEPIQCFLVREILSDDPSLTFLEAACDVEALHLAQIHHPDLVIFDLGGPSLTELRLYAQIRTTSLVQPLPFIFTASWSATYSVPSDVLASECPLLLKPFIEAELQDAVQRTLRPTRLASHMAHPVISKQVRQNRYAVHDRLV